MQEQCVAEAKDADAALAAQSADEESALARVKDAATRVLSKACGRAVTAGLWAQRAHECAELGEQPESVQEVRACEERAAAARAERDRLRKAADSVTVRPLAH